MAKQHPNGKYLFGPVASRRLGISLGIDLVPYKVCSFNCIYCESGATTHLTAERREYVPTTAVIAQLKQLLDDRPEIDYLTFSGAGEPTLHSGIGEIVHFLKDNYPKYKICLLTNASMFHSPTIIAELKPIDLIVPSLDASSPEEYLKINRPSPACDYQTLVDNLINFSHNFNGELWLEIFIVPGINDSDAAINRFVELTRKIAPTKVQFNTLDRPGCVDWLEPSSEANTRRFINAMERVCPVEAVGPFRYQTPAGSTSYSPQELQNRIMALIQRRPCTAADMLTTLNCSAHELQQALDSLRQQQLISGTASPRGEFFSPVK